MLTNTIYAILQKFEIQNQVWGVVCDNALNNANMMNWFKTFNMKCLTGPEACVHCLPHILNLASKAIAAPFLSQCSLPNMQSGVPKSDETQQFMLDGNWDGQDEEDEDEDVDESSDDGSITEYVDPNEEDEEDDGTAPSWALDEPESNDDNDLLDIELLELIASSLDAKELKGADKALKK
ncbi:hypothetical protein FRC11_003494, partial [Ceratobasidium sp. 423]